MPNSAQKGRSVSHSQPFKDIKLIQSNSPYSKRAIGGLHMYIMTVLITRNNVALEIVPSSSFDCKRALRSLR